MADHKYHEKPVKKIRKKPAKKKVVQRPEWWKITK